MQTSDEDSVLREAMGKMSVASSPSSYPMQDLLRPATSVTREHAEFDYFCRRCRHSPPSSSSPRKQHPQASGGVLRSV